jgi:hypothetical protein
MPFMARTPAERTKHRGTTMHIATFHLGALRPQPQRGKPGRHRPAPIHDAAAVPQEAGTVSGWFASSLDLLRGLDVQDLGPAEWQNECEGAVAGA